MSSGLSLKNKVRKLAIKFGLKQYLTPIHEIMNMRKATKLMRLYIPENTEYGLNTDERDYSITISFTTFPARIKSAIYVADTMLRQTIKPDRVIMVLASDELESKDELPKDFIQLEKRGLSIVFAENLKPHNKYQYAMRNYSESIIITVDDDILYPDDLVETLYNSYKKHPNAVSAMRAHRLTFKDKKLLSYNDWEFESIYTDIPVFDLLATGVGGVLYPPMCLIAKKDILFDTSTIKKTCLFVDDIWLKTIELLCDIPVILASQKPPNLLLVPSSQKISLQKKNVDENNNDKAIRDIMQHFGFSDDDIYNRIYK